MKRKGATVYAVCLTILLVAGFLSVSFFAQEIHNAFHAVIGFALSFFLAPTLHELGHVSFAITQNMDYVYVKFFCFRIYLKNGKKRLGFASPFAADETQVLPKSGGNMQRRAARYTIGGLVYSGVFLALIISGALIATLLGGTPFTLWGLLPYTAYLFFLNLPPFEYASGKTDTLVYRGIKKGYPAEKNMLAAMDIQGELYAGKTFAEIDSDKYFNVPQLAEDEPLYAVMLDLRYRYYLEKADLSAAADCLTRLANSQAYLSEREVVQLAAELTYLHSVCGNIQSAEENGLLCREFLKEDTATAKRILMAYSKAVGKTEAIEPLAAQAERALKKERVVGVRKFEEILIARIRSV